MKKRLIIVLSIIILVPLVLFFALGIKLAGQEEQYLQQRFKNILQTRLLDIKAEIMELVAVHERDFLNMQEVAGLDMEGIRAFIRQHRMLRQVFIQDTDGQLLFPPREELQTQRERNFFIRTESIWQDRESFYRPWEDAFDQVITHGWYTWFWGKGLNLIFWILESDGRIIGLEVDGIALVADLIGNLPDSAQISPELAQGRIVLADITGKGIYQWGAYAPAEAEEPLLRLPVDAPLNSWELQYFLSLREFTALVSRRTRVNIVSAAVLGFVLLTALGVYFYRENSRALREAARRVTFVNQVSHELKTPLTNIRLYAELLDGKMDPGDTRLRRYLEVIVSESQRLSRLILNVLSFARDQKEELKLRKTPGNIAEIVGKVIENYRQSFAVAGIQVDFESGVSVVGQVDQDALEQILNNLFSNVEKYAAAGKHLLVVSRLEGSKISIRVCDRGEGIPRDKADKIFRPFFRLSRKLSDGVTGTGLGLTIARRLARLHGGDLKLETGVKSGHDCGCESSGKGGSVSIPGEHEGACFLLTLDVS